MGVYIRISLSQNVVHALEMVQVPPTAVKGLKWRVKKLGKTK